jgi:hypothetical protein
MVLSITSKSSSGFIILFQKRNKGVWLHLLSLVLIFNRRKTMKSQDKIIEKEIFIKISEGEKEISFIHLPFTKNYKEIILKWLKKQK